MEYTKRLYDLRTDNDLKQEDIAKILNTSKQNYGRYENGQRKLSIEDLIKLSKYYHVSTDYILGLEDTKYKRVVIQFDGIPQLTKKETKIKKIIKEKYGKIDYKIIEEISDYLKISNDDVVLIIEEFGYWDIQTYIDLSEYLDVSLDEMLK